MLDAIEMLSNLPADLQGILRELAATSKRLASKSMPKGGEDV